MSAKKKVSRSNSTRSRHKKPRLLEFRLVQLRIDVVVVEHVLLAEELERQGDQEDQVGRIAAVDCIEPVLEIDAPGESGFVEERARIFAQIAAGGIPFGWKRMPIDVHSLDDFVVRLVSFAFRANDRNFWRRR